jgi:hypothetical protein
LSLISFVIGLAPLGKRREKSRLPVQSGAVVPAPRFHHCTRGLLGDVSDPAAVGVLSRPAWANQQIAALKLSGSWQISYRRRRDTAASLGRAVSGWTSGRIAEAFGMRAFFSAPLTLWLSMIDRGRGVGFFLPARLLR